MSQRREVSTIAGLVAPLGCPPRLYARHFRGSIGWERVLVALRYFRRRVGRPLLVVWDRLNAHRAAPVQAFIATHSEDFALEWLPAYAPDLNPEELCNGAVKRALQNAAPASVEELRRNARRGFLCLGRRPDLLHGFFRHAGLGVT